MCVDKIILLVELVETETRRKHEDRRGGLDTPSAVASGYSTTKSGSNQKIVNLKSKIVNQNETSLAKSIARPDR